MIQFRVPMQARQRCHVRHWRIATFTCLIAIFAVRPLLAESAGLTTANRALELPSDVLTHDAEGRVVIRATRITQPITIDGQLDEAAYGEVPVITEFVQSEPNEGAPSTEKTEAWVMFDDENIYVACRCWDEHPERIIANELRRDSDNLQFHDQFAVGFDTFHDGLNNFQFQVSAAGGLRDGNTMNERPNFNWDGVYDAKTSRFEHGWIAEMVIPFKTLRYRPGLEQTWRIQLRRFIPSKNELVYITRLSSLWGLAGMNRPSRAATLVGLAAPPQALNLELKPYALSRVTTDLSQRPALRNDYDPAAGVDLKWGVTKGLIADFTYNTDFAQVEADQAQINLTRFNLVFPEKRDFFLEGQGIFDFGVGGGGSMGTGGSYAPTIFYSRRIGLSGARAVPVIGGGRLAGSVGRWSIGTFNMETDDDAAAGAARTNFTTVRLRRDILRRSYVGGISTRRSVSTAAPGANTVLGLDTTLAFYSNVYFSGYVAKSETQGPRGDDLAYRAQFDYFADRYGLRLDRLVVEKNFNPEVGFLRRENFRRNYVETRFSPRPAKSRVFRKWTYQASLDYITDNHDVLESRELKGLLKADLHSSDDVTVQYLGNFESLTRPFLISDGVLIPPGGYHFNKVVTTYAAGVQHGMSGSTSIDVGSFYGGDKKTATFTGRVVAARLGIEPNLSLNWIDLPQGEFTTTVIGGRTDYAMTPRMFAAALIQYSSSSRSVSTNVRFNWEYQPGSELFVVYTEGRTTFPPRGTELQNRGFAVKINRLFRF